MGTANSKNYPHLGLLKYKKIRPLDLKLPPDLKTILYYYIILKGFKFKFNQTWLKKSDIFPDVR